MNIAKTLNLLKTNKAKTFFLAGLMGLFPSCKMERNEPEEPQNTNSLYMTHNIQENNPGFPVDSFMQHMPNVSDAVFYEPTEDSHCFLFHTNNMGNVDTITELRDVKNRARYICNPYKLARVGNSSVNGSADFVTPRYWVFRVEYQNEYGGGGDWAIDCVTDAEHDSYVAMGPQGLANVAYNRLISKHPEDTHHAERIRDAILNGQGNWTQDEAFNVTFNSNGWQQNLRCSDFGTFDVTIPVYSQGFTSMYSGGLSSKEIQKSAVASQAFKATAYGNFKYEDRNGLEQLIVVSTERDSAKFIIDELQNETIVMPFKNWYKVTIIRTNNSVVSTFENVGGTITETCQVPHQNMQETGYREGIQDNGLTAKDGYAGTLEQDGILTGTSVNYYTDETGYTEFVGQGYRQDWTQNTRTRFTFSFGGTNRPRPEEQITTGLENVYCAPKRNRQR